MSTSLDYFEVAARKQIELPEDWKPYLFVAVEGQGVMVTGMVVTDTFSRGPRKGLPNFGKADRASKRTVFVSYEAYALAKAEA